MLVIEPSARYLLTAQSTPPPEAEAEADFSAEPRYHRHHELLYGYSTSAVATGLAAELLPDSVLLNQPVVRIVQDAEGASVYTSTGEAICCRKVILAIPSNVYNKIQVITQY